MKPRLILLGEPFDIRHKLAKKLSNFFGVKLFTIEDLLDKQSHKSDDLKNEMRFKMSLINACHNGFVLCGFPMNERDLDCLDDIDLCVFFHVDEDKAIEHNSHRRWCPTCQRLYHLKNDKPLHGEKCDRCDTQIEKMPDDDPKVIRKRLINWYKLFNPILSKYKKDKKVLEVKIERDIDKISSKIMAIISKEIEPTDYLDGSDPSFTM